MASSETRKPTSIIIGGGLAGLAAASRSIRHGIRPTVLEKRGYLGGRAFSFTDRETGVVVDNGQHIFLGACTDYIDFISEIGARDSIYEQERLDVPVLKNGVVSRLGWSRVPGMGMLPSLLRYRHLSMADKLRVVYGMMRVRLTNRRKNAETLDQQTFQSWLEARGQNESTIANLWNLIVLPSLNDDIGDVSAAAGLMLFQTALMGSGRDAIIGYSRVGLSELAGKHAMAYVSEHGGDIQLNTDVASLWFEGDSLRGVRLADGSTIQSDAVIAAVPHFALGSLLPEANQSLAPLAVAASLETAPIVGIHIWYDGPVLDEPFIAVVDSPLQFIFNVTAIHSGAMEEPDGGQHVVISLSGAWRWSQMERRELEDLFVAEMARAFPAASTARVTRFLSVKQIDATFRVTPGSTAARLPQTTAVPNLFLAGDWTDTDWPSTMESAVRSGNLAADAAAEHLSR